jgi:hypothetical protein
MTAQTILPANTLSGGYDVANSLRFNDGSSDFLSRSISSTGNRRKWTFSAWVKRSSMGTGSIRLMSVRNGNEQEWIGFDENDIHISRYNNSYVYRYITNRKFRDPSAFYHVCVAMDSEQSTAGNRMKLYVNGVQETSFSTETQISEDYNTSWNTASFTNYIGNNGNSGDYYDGYMSEVVLIDGQQLDPTSFGEFDEDSEIWKPIDVSGLTFGTNGFYLDFENSGSLGADVSGNGNNFTANNLTAIDQTTDTCTNNFATFNPLYKSDSVYSEGNLKNVFLAADHFGGVSTIGVATGKWYAEFKTLVSAGQDVGVGITGNPQLASNTNQGVGEEANSIGYRSDGNKGIEDTFSSYGASYTTNDIIGVALDLTSGTQTIEFFKNGASQGAITISLTPADGVWFLSANSLAAGTADWEANFGSPPFTISSGNTDGNGYGNFEYSVPSGYYALNTKNLAEYG